MRAANITAGIAIALWFALALVGRDGLNGVVAQQVPGYPNMGQINLYIVWPLFVVTTLLACAWFCNAVRRWSLVLGIASGASLLALLPYLMIWGRRRLRERSVRFPPNADIPAVLHAVCCAMLRQCTAPMISRSALDPIAPADAL